MPGSTTIDETPVEEPIVRPKDSRPETREKADKRPQKKKAPRYAVIVQNDDHHTFPYVTAVLRKICGHPLPKAEELTMQIHVKGQALVWSGSLEVAELKRDQIRGFGPDVFASKTVTFPLGVRIEKLP
ncbi:ATP-dependent Clp protease adaptor ClpS [Stratiformator vulcanicus]|uniref:ATP-dependent Clp protease adapter protein ClpS n=1 Tax=Stratiformator vulcanicus TaxID=2527980 RepID=A0A517R552_9PLAN|nr:ATP-dependent Clp protease adaptor ClpS [Stratiformator vulcanicus]QDT39014.1 ATP-dependent Clp protease adaptor [Stratiformator vulcanicus]